MSDTSPTPDRADLPIPDYDHLPIGSLQHRIRSLDEQQLRTVVAYESAHGNRLPVQTALQARLEQLQAGAEPSGGAADGFAPEQAEDPQPRESIGPETTGPAVNPPSHGVPTNPAQPRT